MNNHLSPYTAIAAGALIGFALVATINPSALRFQRPALQQQPAQAPVVLMNDPLRL